MPALAVDPVARRKGLPVTRILSLVCLLALGAIPARAQQAAATPENGGLSSSYADLVQEQRRLVDDWARRFTEVTKRTIDIARGYDQLPLSARTTFGAVTHALLHTPLTGKSGPLRPSAMEIIAHLDGVRGAVPGTGGDQQFRMYVQLVPQAIDLLEQSKEFERKGDNTVFHKGYPICYRSRGRPSIQVSIARDGSIADIDVDYRSSTFPVVLVNGHLASSNSDVRAGNNSERHDQRWTGLNKWWRNMLGLGTVEEPVTDVREAYSQTPITPKNAKPAQAVHDFLTTWFVERKPGEVIPSFGDESVACIQLQSEKPLDRGMLRATMLISMTKTNEAIGPARALGDVVEAVEMAGARVRPIAHAFSQEFTLYDVREDLAEQLKCGNRLDPTQVDARALHSTSYGKYVGAVYRMKAGPRIGKIFATIWSKHDGYWRLVSYTDDATVRVPQALRELRAPGVTPPPTHVDADPALVKAAADFHEQWFVRRDLAKAEAYFSSRALPCIDALLEDDAPAPAAATIGAG